MDIQSLNQVLWAVTIGMQVLTAILLMDMWRGRPK